MIVTITINPQTRAGKINTPYLTAHTVETLCFAAAPSPTEEIPDGTAVALLTPDRKTLAMAFVQGGCVTLNTNTQQAADYFLGCAVNEPKNAVLVVGDTDSIQTIVPVIVRANPLDDLAPPPPLAPNYPTSDELDTILQSVMRAERSAAESAQRAQTSAETATAQAGLASLSKTKAEIVYENVAASVDGGTIRDPETGEDVKTVPGYKTELSMVKETYIGELNRAKEVFSGDLDSHTENLKEELSGEKDAAVQAVQNKATEVSGDLDGKVTAAQNAATEARGHATAAVNSASAASQSASSAAGSATVARQSAEAVEAIKTELQDALTEASGVADRVTELETGRGAYKDPATGEVFYFEALRESDGTIAVIGNNGVAWQIAPMEWAYKGGAYLSQCRAFSDGEYVYFSTARAVDTYAAWEYVAYDKKLNRVSPIVSVNKGYGVISNTIAGPFACFIIDDKLFCQSKNSGEWHCFDLASGTLLKTYTGGGVVVHNKLTKHILAIKSTGVVSVMASADDADSGISIFDELFTYDISAIWADGGGSSMVNQSAYHTYFARNNSKLGAQTLYRIKEDDTIVIVNASYGTTDADGKVVFEEGVTFDGCIVTKSPVTTENGLIPFNKSVSRTVSGTTKSAWASMPIMFSASNGRANETIHIISNGLNFYIVLPDGRCVESYSIGSLWAWIRPDMWNGKPKTLPALTIETVEADTFLPNKASHDVSGTINGTGFGQLVCKATLPSGTVFPLRNAITYSNALPTLGDQKSVHAAAPLLVSKVAIAFPRNSAWSIVGMPSHIIRGDFS